MVLADDILAALERLGFVQAGGHGHGHGQCEACGAVSEDLLEHILRCDHLLAVNRAAHP